MFGQGARRDRREVADAAEILHDASIAAMTVEHIIEERNQRRAFAARGHVGGTKIGDDRHADFRRDHRRLARSARYTQRDGQGTAAGFPW